MKELYLDRNQPLVSETDYACHYWSDSMELLFPYFDFPGENLPILRPYETVEG